jgi:hypothetical protein
MTQRRHGDAAWFYAPGVAYRFAFRDISGSETGSAHAQGGAGDTCCNQRATMPSHSWPDILKHRDLKMRQLSELNLSRADSDVLIAWRSMLFMSNFARITHRVGT